jgi:hypothetical protein
MNGLTIYEIYQLYTRPIYAVFFLADLDPLPTLDSLEDIENRSPSIQQAFSDLLSSIQASAHS